MRPTPQDYKRGRKQPNTRKVTIALDPEVADEFDSAKDRLETAKRMVDIHKDRGGPLYAEACDELVSATEAFDAAKAVVQESSQEFTFKAIGRRAYEDLMMDHLPTADQVVKAKKAGGGEPAFNPDTFPPALILASCVDPILTEADVKEIWEGDEWSQNETTTLFMVALDANNTRRNIDLPKG